MSISQAIKDFPVIRSIFRLVSHSATTGRLQVNGEDVDPYEYTWAAFSILTPSDFAGVNVRVTDRHQDSRGVGGVLLVGGTSWTVLNGGHIYYATLAAAIAEVPAASSNGMRIFPGDVGSPMQSNGTDYLIDGGVSVISRSAVAQRVISPNAAITWTAADNGSGKVRLTASGVHGLTTAICVTAGATYLYATTTQNGWTARGLHLINTIVNTTTIDLDTTWASQGVPLFALAGTEFILRSVDIPPLTKNGFLKIDATWGSTSGSGTKSVGVRLGSAGVGITGTAFYLPTAIPSTHLEIHPLPVIIQNRNATNIQVGQYAAANVGGGANSTTVGAPTGAIQTNVTTDLVLTAMMTSANDPIWIDRYTVEMGT